ncbi:MAG: hypothetical protein JO111_17300 [Caulobacteraceae bacterium]|nr:hypothetical protein [Caulobacteraceae bacterium]
MSYRFALFCTLAILAITAPKVAGQATQGGQMSVAIFTEFPPLARNSEILRRMLSPLTQEVIRRRLVASRTVVAEESVDLAKARFVVYVPSHKPAGGYGLIVFVPPWDDARLPTGWAAVLDRAGFIYVSAVASGNDKNVLTQRVPLALVATGEALKSYQIDPDRVFVGGFSGGSRVALRLALAYPDVFHAVLLNAGADPIGAPPDILPSADLFARFQGSRILFVTGALDTNARASDAATAESMSKLCVFNDRTINLPDTGHSAVPPAVFSETLDDLQRDHPADQRRLDACRATLDARLTREVDEANAAVAARKSSDARSRILALDRSFGGLAGRQIAELAAACACGLLPEEGRK